MKKVIPFKKELPLEGKVYEISSISLEHEILEKQEDLISGEFLVSGSYKISPTSIEKEKFEFTLPFDIALNSRYDIDNMVIDIDDFYYEIINNNTLKVNIDLYLDGEIIKEEVKEESLEIDNETNDQELERCIEKEDNIMQDKDINNEEVEEIINNHEEVEERDIQINNENVNKNTITENSPIFDDISGGETYATYHVYIVKEEDTIDTILTKYEISKEDLESYNNIVDIKKGDKLIIPKTNNEWF